MKSPERFNPENQDSLWNLRRQVDSRVGKPYPNETKMVVWQYKGPLEKALFDPLFSDKNRLKRHLMKLQTELYPNNPYSAPLACASQVNYAKEGIMAEAKIATSSETQDDMFKFAFLFDIAYGMGLVANSVVAAEDNLRNPSEIELSKAADNFAERFDLNPVQNAEVFLRSRRLVSRFSELLKKDNSGLSLIEEVKKLLKDSKYSEKKGIEIHLPPFFVREFVSTGADLGEKLYKKLYPLTDQTTPPKSSWQ